MLYLNLDLFNIYYLYKKINKFGAMKKGDHIW